MDTDEGQGPQLRVVDRRWWARGETTAETDEAAARKPTVVEDLERRLSEVTAQLIAVRNEQRRAQEEFEQARVRLRRDVGREVERGTRAVLTELLEVMDNLERAIGAARSADGTDAFMGLRSGVELVRDQFLAKLEAFGVRRTPALGERFDAARHEAVTTTPVSDPAQDDMIVAVVRDGYSIGDDLLRPASVVVGKA